MNIKLLNKTINDTGLLHKDISKKVKIKQSTLSRILNGKSSCSLENADKIKRGLNLDDKLFMRIFFD